MNLLEIIDELTDKGFEVTLRKVHDGSRWRFRIYDHQNYTRSESELITDDIKNINLQREEVFVLELRGLEEKLTKFNLSRQ